MPVSLPNTTTADNYPVPGSGGAQVQARDVFQSGWFTVANAAVFAQYAYGRAGLSHPSPDLYLAPGTYPLTGTPINPINGIRFKSAVAGTPAQVWGAFFYKNDPVLESSAEFTSNVSPTGSVIPSTGVMQLLQTQIFNIAGNNFQFSAITQAFNNLLIVYAAQSAIAANFEGLFMQFNSDGGNNYDRSNTDGSGPPAAVASAGQQNVNAMTVGVIPGNASGNSDFGGGEMLIPNYSNAVGRKFVSCVANATETVAGATWFNRISTGLWHPGVAQAITSIFITTASGNNFVIGSRFFLYGL